jgi:hypothetical protein
MEIHYESGNKILNNSESSKIIITIKQNRNIASEIERWLI